MKNVFDAFVISAAACVAILAFWLGGLHILLFTAASLTIILRVCLYTGIPVNNYGERRFFGWRGKASMLIKRGWGFWIPPFLGGDVAHFTLVNLEISGETEIATADKSQDGDSGAEKVMGRELVLKIPWFLEFSIDPNVFDDNGRVKFLGLDWGTIQKGISSFLDSKLSKLGGTLSSDDISNMLREIEDYLRAFLQCTTPPHLSDPNFDGNLLDWYKKNAGEVKEAVLAKSNSDFEKEYGIHIRAFRIKTPLYDEQTTEDIRQEYREEQRRKAAERVLATAKKATEIDGVSGEKALDSAKMLHQVPNVREVILSTNGGGNSIPVLSLGDVLGGTGGKPAATSSGRKGGGP